MIRSFPEFRKFRKKTEIKKPNNGEVILPFLMFSQPAECRGVGNRAILRPPLTFSATLYRFSMEALWELRVLSTQPTTLRCQYVEVYTTARPQRTSAKLLLSIMLNFYSGLLNKYITTNQQNNAFNLCPWFGQSRISLDNVILSLDNVMTFLISSPILDNVAWFRLSTPDYGQFCTFSYISQNIMDNSVPFVRVCCANFFGQKVRFC